MDKEIEEFWTAAQKAVPGLSGTPKVRQLTANREVAENLLKRIVAGLKFGTCSLPWLHGRTPGLAPETGALIIYTDADGKPRALVRQKKPQYVAYGDVNDSHTEVEGEGSAAKQADTWRKIHGPHYGKQLEAAGLTLSDDTPIAVERFEILYPKS
jgi:uncharacterized protein YhfF